MPINNHENRTLEVKKISQNNDKTVKVTIEIPAKLYGAIQLYYHEPHETMNDTIIELIREGINSKSNKAYEATKRRG
jgi:hypothetical protein